MTETKSKETDNLEEHLNDFVELAHTIVTEYGKKKKAFVRQKDIVAKTLNKYIQTLAGTEAEEHAVFFDKVLVRHIEAITNGPILAEKVKWLEGDVYIQFGEGKLDTKDLDPSYRIYLGKIFERAKYLQSLANDSLDGQEITDDIVDKFPELEYPDKFLYFLYLVFSDVASETNKKRLEKPISDLKKILCIEDEVKESSPAASSGMMGPMGPMDMSNPLSQFLGPVMGLMSSLNINPAMQGPPPEKIGDVLGAFLNNDKTKQMLQRVSKSATACQSFTDVVGALGKELKESDIGGTLSTIISDAANQKPGDAGNTSNLLSAKDIVSSVVPSLTESTSQTSVSGPTLAVGPTTVAGPTAAAEIMTPPGANGENTADPTL